MSEKTCTKCGEAKPVEAFYREKRAADGRRSDCGACNNASRKKWCAANNEKIAPRKKRWAEENYDKVLETNRRASNKHRKSYPHKNAAQRAAYRARLLQQTIRLTSAQKAEIAAVYAAARDMTLTTGIKHHVDHIIPLNGESVRGLHVPWNLQVLTAAANTSKQNKVAA